MILLDIMRLSFRAWLRKAAPADIIGTVGSCICFVALIVELLGFYIQNEAVFIIGALVFIIGSITGLVAMSFKRED